MENLDKAKKFYKKSLNIYQILFGENSVKIVELFNSLSEIYFNIGNLVYAKKLKQNSLKIYLKLYGENHADTGKSYTSLAEVCLNTGNLIKMNID